jgi:hypothetical protein
VEVSASGDDVRVRRFLGFFRHHQNFAKMQREIKVGDTITYIDRGQFFQDNYDICSARVGYVPGGDAEWVVVAVLDRAVEWDNILEWTPR